MNKVETKLSTFCKKTNSENTAKLNDFLDRINQISFLSDLTINTEKRGCRHSVCDFKLIISLCSYL